MDMTQEFSVSEHKVRSSHKSLAHSPLHKTALSESIARVQEALFEAQEKGNTRKVQALRMVLRRFKALAERPRFLH